MPGERGGLLSAGGILSITVGAAQVIIGGIITAISGFNIPLWLPSLPYFGNLFDIIGAIPTVAIIIGISLIVLGIMAIIGGTAAMKRSRFGLALAGAICALPSGALGVLAVIFVSLAKGEFEPKISLPKT
jgi:hypothetical protein